MTNVLIFIDWFLPGYKAGGPIQSIANMANHLSGELDISIVTSNKDLGESKPYSGLSYNKWINYENYRVIYLDEAHQNIKQHRDIINERDYSSIYLNSLFSYLFTILPLWAARKSKSSIVLAPRGMLGAGALNIKSRRKQLFLTLIKLTKIAKTITWHATAETEANEIKYHFGNSVRIKIAPNLSAKMQKTVKKNKYKNSLRLFFLSRIALKKNLKTALSLLKKVDKKYKIEYTIIGPVGEDNYWFECQELIKQMPQNITVSYKGAIPNYQLTKYLQQEHALLLPTFHENFGHVIMEAWQNGCPVIISDQTPWIQLENKKIGWDISLGRPEQFVSAIEALSAMDQETYNEMSQATISYAKEFTQNPEVVMANLKLFQNE